MRMRLLLALCCAVLLAVPAVPAVPAVASAASEQASSGQVQAKLSYTKHAFDFSTLRLTITRGGRQLFSGDPSAKGCPDTSCWPAGIGTRHSLHVRDLDGDGEPEVVVDMYTGGAHCCEIARVYRFTGSGYKHATKSLGDPGYTLKDLDGDGRAEFVTADDRFAYRFTAFAYSGFPIQVWRYDAGHFANVTTGFPAAIRKDARKWFHAYRKEARTKDGDARGVLAAYVADEYLLKRGSVARRELRVARRHGWLKGYPGWKSGSAYITDLLGFLKRTHYR